MPRIFISYRRMDSQAIATLIYHRLVKEYGEKNVFLDTKAIRSGLWWDQVKTALIHADVVVVVVGPKWETEIQRRSDSGDDYVREEVRIALEQNKAILLAFVDGENGIDPNLLPEDIRDLPKYQGYQILHEPFFDASMELLMQNIPKTKRKLSLPFVFGMMMMVAVIFGVIFLMNNMQNRDNPLDDSQSDSTELVIATSGVVDTPVLPTPTRTPNAESTSVADGYDLPIGTADERAGDEILPSGWMNATGFATMIGGIAYNTGADLNFGTGNADLGLPVYAIASGEVIFQDELPVWGNIIVIRHDPLFISGGIVAYSRYSSIRNVMVNEGDRVIRGQQIAEIGTAQGQFSPHLNFDISTTRILEANPADYPRMNLDYLLENYVDPLEFIRNNRPKRNIACLTPYMGKTLLWYWKGDSVSEQSIDEFATNLRQNAPNVAGVIVKVMDGEDWQGKFDTSALAIDGVEDIAEWVRVLEAHGLELHIWAVPNKLDTSPDLLASVANVAGVKSLILDVESYYGFWEGTEAEVTAFVAVLRARITNPDFHISIAVDPRSFRYDTIFPDAWRPFIDSVHLQLFWTVFRQIPEDTIQDAWETWGDYGLPLIPMLQSDAPISEQQVAFNNLTDAPFNVVSITWWRAGVTNDYTVVNQIPPTNCTARND